MSLTRIMSKPFKTLLISIAVIKVKKQTFHWCSPFSSSNSTSKLIDYKYVGCFVEFYKWHTTLKLNVKHAIYCNLKIK